MKELFDLLKSDPKSFFKELASAIALVIIIWFTLWFASIFQQ